MQDWYMTIARLLQAWLDCFMFLKLGIVVICVLAVLLIKRQHTWFYFLGYVQVELIHIHQGYFTYTMQYSMVWANHLQKFSKIYNVTKPEALIERKTQQLVNLGPLSHWLFGDCLIKLRYIVIWQRLQRKKLIFFFSIRHYTWTL